MSSSVSILCFAGSLRKDSYNKKLVKEGMKGAEEAGAKCTYIELNDFELPIFNEDWEAEHGLHPNAKALKELFAKHQGLLISSPEYNSSLSGVMKNTIDWLSRKAPGEKPLASFSNKVSGLLSASPGALGGLRGLYHLREILQNIGVLVHPTVFSLPKANEAFNANGTLIDEETRTKVKSIGITLTHLGMNFNTRNLVTK